MPKAVARCGETVLELIRREIGDTRYNTWFRAVEIREAGEQAVEICAPNIFIREWLHRNYGPLIESCLRQAQGGEVEVRFGFDPELASRLPPEGKAGLPAEPEPARSAPSAPPHPRAAEPGMNPSFRLDAFVVGACNRLAHGAVCAVCEEPGTLYNPLFIYGASGLGKTHLLQGAVWEFKRRRPRLQALYLTGESFVNQYVESIQKKRMGSFRERFRNADLLVVDDVHVLSNKGRTQEEFLHTFNACFEKGRQIVMASDSHPDAIASLRKELHGRFSAGLLARLDPPSFRTRLDILREKARSLPAPLPEDVLAFVAQHVKSSVRSLEGALTSLAARATLLREPVTVEEARRALSLSGEGRERIVTLGDVEETVLARFGITAQDLHSKSRRRDVLLPRHLCMTLARRLTSHSLDEIGRYFGKRDHVSVLYAIRKVDATLASDAEFARLVSGLEETIRELR
ncbi:MAG: chromosomal replication initiator protein DnaA [Planctomycetes bacterium]|nr:chromosomal replication initiator protein DnaA [Planctomycetota bacterium]